MKINKTIIILVAVFTLACGIAIDPIKDVNTVNVASATSIFTPTAIRVSPTRVAEWYVCTESLHIRSSPTEDSRSLGFLVYGDPAYVREWSHNGNGWAMIAPARWVNGDYLCRNPQWQVGVPTPFVP